MEARHFSRLGGYICHGENSLLGCVDLVGGEAFKMKHKATRIVRARRSRFTAFRMFDVESMKLSRRTAIDAARRPS